MAPLTQAATDVMREAADGRMDDTDLDNLLYTLARDNEMEELRRNLKSFPELLRVLACRAKVYPDYHARWQIVTAVAEVRLQDAANLIRPYLNDEDEYVRRRALQAFATFCPEEAEQMALGRLDDDFEYARFGALAVLAEIGSSFLLTSARRLASDPNQHLRDYANKILEENKKP